MAAHLDHLVIGGADLGILVAWWNQTTKVEAVRGGSHPGVGTRNALVGVGADTYIELIAVDPEQPEPAGPRPFGIDDLEPGSVQLCTFMLAVPDVDAATSTVRDAGFDPGPIRDMARTRPDGVELSWRLALPSDSSLGGTLPGLIQWGDDTEHPATSLAPAIDVVEVTLTHPDPPALSSVFEGLGYPIAVVEGPAPSISAHLRTADGIDVHL